MIHFPGFRIHGTCTTAPVRAPTTMSNSPMSAASFGMSSSGYVPSASAMMMMSCFARCRPVFSAAP